jgi:hypothetical protein
MHDLYLYNKMKLETLPNKMVKIVTLLTCIQDALGSISGWNDYPEDFRGFPQSPQMNGHNRFLPHPLDLSNGKDIQTRVDINCTRERERERERGCLTRRKPIGVHVADLPEGGGGGKRTKKW